MTAKSRFSVALDEREYSELATMAERHRVSMAWLVRNAIGEFLGRYRDEDRQLPLLLTASRSGLVGTQARNPELDGS